MFPRPQAPVLLHPVEMQKMDPRVLRANVFKGLGSPVPEFLFLYSLKVQKATLSNC